MQIAFSLLYGVFGAVVGAVLNLIIDRAPERVSLLRPPPHCDACGRSLETGEMIPLVSYVQLRGRCRTCGAAIPVRMLLVEAGTALLFACLAWQRGLGFELLADSVYVAVFVAIAVIDLEHRLILNRVVFPALWITAGLALLRMALGATPYLYYGYWQAVGWAPGLAPALLGLASQAAGFLLGFAIFFVLYLISPRGLGDGDVRLAALAGMITGFPGVVVATFGSFLLAAITGLVLMALGKATRKSALPFAPFLVLATWAVYRLGDGWLMAFLQR